MGKRPPADPFGSTLGDATTDARCAKVMQRQLGIVHDIDQALLTLGAAEAIDATARERATSALGALHQTLAEGSVAAISARTAPTPLGHEVEPTRSPG